MYSSCRARLCLLTLLVPACSPASRYCDTELLLESPLYTAWGNTTQSRLDSLQARLDTVLLQPGSVLHRLAVRVQVQSYHISSDENLRKAHMSPHFCCCTDHCDLWHTILAGRAQLQ